jgi:hypothetical protein
MSDVAIAEQPTARQIGRREASKPLKVTGRLKQALHLMVWDAQTDNEAAVATGLTIHAIRQALGRPHVRQYLMQQREVLRASLAPRNIHRLREIRDAADNMPAVNAIKVLEQIGDEQQQRGSGASVGAGVVIRIVNQVAALPAQSSHVLPNSADDDR